MMRSGSNIEEGMITSLKQHNYAFTWVINNYSEWRENAGGAKCSKKFPSGNNGNIQWVLSINPKSQTDATFCSLFLKLISKERSQDNVSAKFFFIMENSNGETINNKFYKSVFAPNECHGVQNWIQTEKLLQQIKSDDQLIIKCKIQVIEEIDTEVIRKNWSEPLPSSLSKDFKTLVDGEKYGDVTILIDGQRFLTYKGILAARSAVFAAMFDPSMKEKIENCITISDVSPNVFKALLRYFYTDELPSAVDTMAHELYTVADKYAVPTLKSLCRCHILKKLNWETAAETLVLAEMHSDQEMKRHALRFLGESEAGKFTESGGWKKMVRSHPYLVDETVKALAAGRVVGARK